MALRVPALSLKNKHHSAHNIERTSRKHTNTHSVPITTLNVPALVSNAGLALRALGSHTESPLTQQEEKRQPSDKPKLGWPNKTRKQESEEGMSAAHRSSKRVSNSNRQKICMVEIVRVACCLACLLACLLACMPACYTCLLAELACLPACLPACPPACPLACLPATIFNRFHQCRLSSDIQSLVRGC